MLRQVIGLFLQVLMRPRSRLRVQETLSVLWIVLMLAISIQSVQFYMLRSILTVLHPVENFPIVGHTLDLFPRKGVLFWIHACQPIPLTEYRNETIQDRSVIHKPNTLWIVNAARL